MLRYLGRYTHRVAISNRRLLHFDGERVTFLWRDYAHGNKQRKMTVPAEEFIRRFLVHVLPRGFLRIRNFGFLTNRRRAELLPSCRQFLNMGPLPSAGNTVKPRDTAQCFAPCAREPWSRLRGSVPPNFGALPGHAGSSTALSHGH